MERRNGEAYSQDLRSRVLAASDRGLSARAVAQQFAVSVSYVIKARQRRDRTGVTQALKPRQTQVRKLASHAAALRERVERKRDQTLVELRDWLRADRGVTVSITALWQELRHLDLTLKKGRSTRPSRIAQIWPRPAPSGEQRKVA